MDTNKLSAEDFQTWAAAELRTALVTNPHTPAHAAILARVKNAQVARQELGLDAAAVRERPARPIDMNREELAAFLKERADRQRTESLAKLDAAVAANPLSQKRPVDMTPAEYKDFMMHRDRRRAIRKGL